MKARNTNNKHIIIVLTSKHDERIYFVCERDGKRNLMMVRRKMQSIHNTAQPKHSSTKRLTRTRWNGVCRPFGVLCVCVCLTQHNTTQHRSMKGKSRQKTLVLEIANACVYGLYIVHSVCIVIRVRGKSTSQMLI